MMHTSVFHLHKSLISFNSSLLEMCGHLLGPRSFNSPKRLLVHTQTSFPLTFDGVGFILRSTIAPTGYLKSWALVVSIITIRFMANQHSFLFEVLTQVDNNTFIFQQHFKTTFNILSPLTCVCFLPFEQLIRQQMIQFQNSILGCQHCHTLSNMFFDATSKAHNAQILSCLIERRTFGLQLD
jgi:hypothetical protein